MSTRDRLLRFTWGLFIVAAVVMMGVTLRPATPRTAPQPGGRQHTLHRAAAHDEEEEPFAPPTLSGPEQTLDTEHFRIHYTLVGQDAVAGRDRDGNGHPDYVDEVARTLEHVRQVEVEKFGWTPPPGDGEWGGNALYDVYLHDIEDALGYVDAGAPETIVGDNPNSPDVIEKRAGFSYMGLDNDYAGEEGDPLQMMRTTAAHEYHHAIQAGYDAEEPLDWLWEATATWMQDEVYDDINDANQELEMIFKAGPSCQLAYGSEDAYQNGGDWYGLWILLRTVSERYGHATVRAIWEAARTQDGLAALETALAGVDTNLDSLLQEYAVSLLLRDFEEGADYPTVRLEGRTGVGAFRPENGVGQSSAAYVEIDAHGIVTVSLESQGLRGVLVGVRGRQASLFAMPGGSIRVDGGRFDHLYLIVRNPSLPRTDRPCRIEEYTVRVAAANGSPGRPTSRRPAPHFTPPTVEPPLEDGAYEFDGGSAPLSPLAQTLREMLPNGYAIEDVFDVDASEFDEEEVLWIMPGGNGAAALLTSRSGSNFDVFLSISPFPDLSSWLAAVKFDPPPEELRTVDDVPVLLETWDDDYRNVTLIHDGYFYVVGGEVSEDELFQFVRELL